MNVPRVLSMRVGVASEQNARYRRTMEDQHIVQVNSDGFPNQGFFAVIDGHGGRQAADFVEGCLFELFREFLKKANGTKTVGEVFDETFVEMDQRLKSNSITLPGCTIAAAYVDGSKGDGTYTLHTANLGDARAVLSRSGTAARLSFDHKASDPNEQQRIMAMGGFIMRERVNGTLAITRALGDIPLKPYVVAHPYTTETQLTERDTLLVLACDGVWDVMTDQEAVTMAADIPDPTEASKTLIKESLERGSMDNITAMVVRFNWMSGGVQVQAGAV